MHVAWLVGAATLLSQTRLNCVFRPTLATRISGRKYKPDLTGDASMNLRWSARVDCRKHEDSLGASRSEVIARCHRLNRNFCWNQKYSER
jgi:hypothetical protein